MKEPTKRNLDRRINWDSESERMELLDWQHNEQDFDLLCDFVLKRFRSRLKNIIVEQLFPMPVLRDLIRRAAERFEEKHISLPFFVYMQVKEVVLIEVAKGEQKRKK